MNNFDQAEIFSFTVGLFLPIILIMWVLIMKTTNSLKNGKVNAKRRENIKIVQNNEK